MTKYGLTDSSAASTASFANVVTHKFGDFKTGTKLAELAMSIVDRQKNKFNETQALNTANQNVLGWVKPIRSRIPYHVRAYESGILSGNMEGACVGKWFTYWSMYHSASPLGVLEADMTSMIPKARKMGFIFFANFYSIVLQLVHNLMGKSENTIKFIGKAMDETSAEWIKKMPGSMVFLAFRSYAFVTFGEFEKGAEDALERGHAYNEKMIGMQYGMEPFYRGISLYAMARKTGEKKYKKPASEVRKQYQVWVKKGCVNLVGLLQLLDAEHFALSRKKKVAYQTYEKAISTLVAGGFYNNAGVACERYGTYLSETGQTDGMRARIEQAIVYYNRWGAKRKVDLLKEQL